MRNLVIRLFQWLNKFSAGMIEKLSDDESDNFSKEIEVTTTSEPVMESVVEESSTTDSKTPRTIRVLEYIDCHTPAYNPINGLPR